MSNDDFVHDEIIESEVEFDDSEIVEADFDPPREVDNSKTWWLIYFYFNDNLCSSLLL